MLTIADALPADLAPEPRPDWVDAALDAAASTLLAGAHTLAPAVLGESTRRLLHRDLVDFARCAGLESEWSAERFGVWFAMAASGVSVRAAHDRPELEWLATQRRVLRMRDGSRRPLVATSAGRELLDVATLHQFTRDAEQHADAVTGRADAADRLWADGWWPWLTYRRIAELSR